MAERPTVSLADLDKLREQGNKPQKLSADEVNDFAVATLMVTRGLTRGDKLRVLTKARRLLGG